MRTAKFNKKNYGTVIIHTATKQLADIGWSFDSEEYPDEYQYIERFPNTELHFGNSEDGMGCRMITYATRKELSNYDSEPTENPGDDYETTLADILFLLEKGQAEIISDDNDIFEIIG
jgi:hypothetical protein